MAKATSRELIEIGLRYLLSIMLRSAERDSYETARAGVLEIKDRAICTGLHVVCGCTGPGAAYIDGASALDAWASKHAEHGPEDDNDWSPIKVELNLPLE